jgi:hypothetical protein
LKCPQCGNETPDAQWNCVHCRINVYWASQHFDELARIRKQHGDPASPPTPSFLRKVHKSAMDDRSGRGGDIEHRVRQIARMTMHEKTEPGQPSGS